MASDDLDIPVGRKARTQDDFVSAVEQRAALLREEGQPAPSEPRRSRRWLMAAVVAAGIVVILVVIGFLYVRSEQGPHETVAGAAGSLAPSDATNTEETAEAVEPDAMETASAGSLAPSDDTGAQDAVEAIEPDAAETASAGSLAPADDTGTEETVEAVEPDVMEAVDADNVAATEESVSETADSGTETTEPDAAAATEAVETMAAGGTELSVDDQDAAASDTGGVALDDTQVTDEAESGLTLPDAQPEDVTGVAVEELESTTAVVDVDETMAVGVTETAETDQVDETGAASDTAADTRLPVKPAGANSGARVQLAAYGSEERAQTAWTELKPSLVGMLGDHDPMIEEAILDSGTFYRLQIGSFSSSIEALNFCNAVMARQLDCLVVPQ